MKYNHFVAILALFILTVLAPLPVHSEVVGGPVPSGAIAVGNPVGTGGVYNATPPTFTTGQRAEFQTTTRGFQVVAIGDATGAQLSSVGAPADSTSTGNASGLNTKAFGMLYNGAGSFDRQQSIQAAVGLSTGIGITAVEENGRSFSHQNTNTTFTVKASAGFLHNVFVGTPGTGETISCFDNATTATGTQIFLLTPTSAGANMMDIRFANGLTCITAGTTAGDYTFAYR